jgi:glycosyltransferase involved in cell wall biosynthesis
MGLSPKVVENVAAAFRSSPGKKVYDVYLNDPELQRHYPLALLAIGQRDFLGWLKTYGRADQGLTDEEILWFLYESAEDPVQGISLTYLLNPNWQKTFPLALTVEGWPSFIRALEGAYGQLLDWSRLAAPAVISREDQQLLLRSGLDTNPAFTSLQGVNMLSHFCATMGIQQAALMAKRALEQTGLRTSCRDIPVSRRTIPGDRASWLGLELFPITILNQAATPYFISGYQRGGLHRRDDVYRIAYWNWELENVPDEWVKAAELVNEIWSPTQFVADAMRRRMPKPVLHMLPGVEVGPIEDIDRASLNVPENDYVFLFMFDLHSQIHRKNPVAVFRAFREAFRADDAATLIIKTSGGDTQPADLALLRETIHGPNVILVDEMMTRPRAYGLIAMSDCFVSLHRAEGFGLGIAEAMLLAKPVIATGYSGNLDFMDRTNSLLVDYERVEIKEDRPIYPRGEFWAEPSVEQAAAYMREVYERPADARARAERALPGVERLLSLEAAGRRMRTRLEQIAPN